MLYYKDTTQTDFFMKYRKAWNNDICVSEVDLCVLNGRTGEQKNQMSRWAKVCSEAAPKDSLGGSTIQKGARAKMGGSKPWMSTGIGEIQSKEDNQAVKLFQTRSNLSETRVQENGVHADQVAAANAPRTAPDLSGGVRHLVAIEGGKGGTGTKIPKGAVSFSTIVKRMLKSNVYNYFYS